MTDVTFERFEREDLYFYNKMDDVFVRWDHKTRKLFQKFSGGEEFECSGWPFFKRSMNEGVEVKAEDYREA